MTIPKIFHRVWLAQDAQDVIPEEFEYYWNRLKQLHAGWQFVTWSDEADLFAFMRCRKEYDAATTHAGRSDVARYEILAKHGGVYLDTDVEPLQRFDPLVEEDRPFAGWEDDRMICPTVMGGPPEHPALTAILDALPAWVAHRPRRPPNQQTGPYLLTHLWRNRPDVRLLAPIAFYPTHWSEKWRLEKPQHYMHESFAVHHWAASWLPDGPPQRAVAGEE